MSSYMFSPIANMFFNSAENSTGHGNVGNSSLLGIFIFRKLLTRSQLAHPFRYSPLVKHGKPMLGGLPNRLIDGSFIQGIGTWMKEATDGTELMIEDAYNRYHPNKWVGRYQGSLRETILKGGGQ
jgi:hypothetical protein